MARIATVLALLVLAALVRPPAPVEPGAIEGNLPGAMELLAQGQQAVAQEPTGPRAFDASYQHYGAGEGGRKEALARLAIEPPPAAMAGLVAIATALGLKDLTALFLYMRSDEAEDEGDFAMMELCLQAIPCVDPKFLDAYIILGYLWQDSQPDKAEALLRQGLRWNSDVYDLWFQLAWLELRKQAQRPHKDYRMVLEYTRGALAVQHPLFVRRFQAMVLQAAGDPKAAQAVYEDMLAQKGLSAVDRLQAQEGLAFVRKGVIRLESWERQFTQSKAR